MAKNRLNRHSVFIGILIGILLLLGGYVVWLLGITLVNPWALVGGSAVVAFATGVVLHRIWHKVTDSHKFYVNFIVNGLVMTFVISALVLSINYFTVKDDSKHVEKLVVKKVYTKTRHRSRRINRRVYTQGEPYKVYFIEIGFPDLRTKDIEVTFDTFRHLHKNDSVEISLGKGLLGMTVLNSSSITRVPKQKAKSRFPS